MAQEAMVTDMVRARYPSRSRSRRNRDYLLASQNIWAKALSVIGVGMLLLLAYAVFPETSLVIVGVSLILLGLCLFMCDRLLKYKCKSGDEDLENNGERGGGGGGDDGQAMGYRVRPVGSSSNTSTTRRNNSMIGDDIWTCPVPMDWPFPPPSPPPLYSPTNPVPPGPEGEPGSDQLDDVDMQTHHLTDSDDNDESDNDTVTDLPIMFPIRSRRRCISTPPLPSYEDVVEEDRRGRSLTLSSLPSLPSYYASVMSSVLPPPSLSAAVSIPISPDVSENTPTSGSGSQHCAQTSISATSSTTSSTLASSRSRAASLPATLPE